MRDIKFRGRDIVTGEWRHGYLIGVSSIIGDDAIARVVCPSTVGQFTGLVDKNGVEIYEGETLLVEGAYIETVDIGNGDHAAIASTPEWEYEKVEWSDQYAAWVVMPSGDMLADICEVSESSGNIHDNPELIEGESDV